MVLRVRAARHYQHPQAPVRRIADHAIPGLGRALKTALKAARRKFDTDKAVFMLKAGRYMEVADLVDWTHQQEALRHPMNMLGDVWLRSAEAGVQRLNGQFTSRRRVVRYRKAASHEERRADGQHRTPHVYGQDDYLASVAVAKDRADLFNFDRFDPVTQTRIRAFQDALITQLGTDSRVTIEEVILYAMRLGLTPEQIVDRIRAVIGLTDRQALAVARFRDQMETMNEAALKRRLVSTRDQSLFREALAAGRSLTQASIDQIVANYENAYLDHRAMTIATTEATRAASLGLQDSYTQAVNRGVLPSEAVRQYWQISLDEKTCDHCLSVVDQNPDGVPLGEAFDSDEGPVDAPPYHPNCRCSLEFVTNLDLVPDEDA